MLLMIDNYDSFVYNLVRYFKELDEEIIIYRNDKITIHDIGLNYFLHHEINEEKKLILYIK